jgi:hypothetical protein
MNLPPVNYSKHLDESLEKQLVREMFWAFKYRRLADIDIGEWLRRADKVLHG